MRLLLCCMVATATSSGAADTIVDHVGSSNPTTEGWTYVPDGPQNEMTLQGGTEFGWHDLPYTGDPPTRVDYWQVLDEFEPTDGGAGTTTSSARSIAPHGPRATSTERKPSAAGAVLSPLPENTSCTVAPLPPLNASIVLASAALKCRPERIFL